LEENEFRKTSGNALPNPFAPVCQPRQLGWLGGVASNFSPVYIIAREWSKTRFRKLAV